MLKRLSLVLVPSALLLGAFLLAQQLTSSPPAALAAGSADVKLVSQTVGTPNGSNQCVNPAPTTFAINTPTVVCTRITFHNNGPMNPADVSISRSASFVPALGQGSSECTVTPTGGLLTFNNVPTSVTMTRDENYTVSCSKPSSHKFRFTNTLSPGPAGTTDPDTSNNSATTDLDVGVTAVVDFDITSQVLKDSDCVSAPPATILINTNAVFCIVKTIHNNGPYGPSTADIFFRSDPPTDCTLIPFVDTNGAIIDVSVTYTHTELFTLNCSAPSNHSFLIENFVNPTDPHTTDPDGTDYYATSHTVAVIGQTDVKVQSQTATGPASGQPGVPFTVTVNKTLHNNGPFGPANVSIAATASAPADCTVTPGANPTSATLAVSVPSAQTETFTVTCTDPSSHVITVTNCIQTNDPHLNDSNTANNCQTSTVTVPITVNADLKVESQTVTGPPNAQAGQPFTINVNKTVHNNGPFSPVQADLTGTLSLPGDCTGSGGGGPVTLTSSVATPVSETYTITCTAPSDHTISVTNCIAPTNPHVLDTVSANNCKTSTHTLAILGEADVKVSAQELIDPPLIPLSFTGVDMDPSIDVPNTKNSLGTTQTCNTVGVGQSITIDAVVRGVPAFNGSEGGIAGYGFQLIFDPLWVKVTSVSTTTQILSATAGSGVFDFSGLPGSDSIGDLDAIPEGVDGSFPVAAADFGPTESGDGIMARFTLEGVGNGISALSLDLTPPDNTINDSVNNVYTVTTNASSEIRVGSAPGCPSAVTPSPSPSPTPSPTPSPVPTPPPPGELVFDIGEVFQLKLIKTMHNNGPFGPVNVDIDTVWSAPPDCNVVPSPTNPPAATLPVSTSVTIIESFLVSCSEPSSHDFAFTNCLDVTTQHVSDPQTGNNCVTSSINVTIAGQADVKVQSQSIGVQPQANVGQPFTVTINKALHNNGPFSPAPVTITATPTVPADCTVTPGANPASASLAASTTSNITETFSVTCSSPSNHSISVQNCIASADPHLIDPDTGNNCQTSSANVAINAQADIKINSQVFKAADCTGAAPTVVPPNTNVQVCLVTVVHNNGPLTPLDATLSYTSSASTGCTVTPPNGSQAVNGMQSSVSQTVNQVVTLHCTGGGAHVFNFNTTLAATNPHVSDPVSVNNVLPVVFDATGPEADPKVVSVTVNCPPDANTGTPFTCTVDTVVHNNGPTSPAIADLSITLVPPFDCTVTPGAQTSNDLSLVVSSSQTITKTWSVTCNDYSFHLFTGQANLTPDPAGPTDTNLTNNSGSGQDTTAINATTDIKVTSVAGTVASWVPLNSPFPITVDVSVHNNGPVAGVKVEGGAGVAVPSDCTLGPGPYQLFNIMSIPVSSTQVISKSFTVTCTQEGPHQFTVCGRAGPNTLHVIETSQWNNFAHSVINTIVQANSPTFVPTTTCSILGDPPEVCGNGIDDDGDALIDEEPDTDLDGQSDCVDTDDDGDGYPDTVEQFIGTDSLNDCARGPFDSAWPPDFNNSRSVNISDVLMLKSRFGSASGSGTYASRYDLNANGTINISDVLGLKPRFGLTCN